MIAVMTSSAGRRPFPSSLRRSLAAGAVAAAVVTGVGAAGAGAAAAAPAWAPVWAPADGGARITAERKAEGGVDITIDSPALGRSVQTRILLPKGWKRGSRATWPVLYAFHGGQDDYRSWARNTDIEAWAAEYGAIVVMPEGGNGGYANWHNYGNGGPPRWEDFHTVEVRQLLERNYGAGAARAAIGNSSGGSGALGYAARHPGLFRYAASLSGVVSMRSGAMPALLMLTNAANWQDPFAIWGVPWADEANWRAHDPYWLAPRLRGTGVFVSSGTTGRPGPGDPDVAPWDVGLLSEIAIGENNREFARRLQELGIPHTAHLYGDGRHNWPAWIREARAVWPTLMQAIGARRT